MISSWELYPGPVDFDETNPADPVVETGPSPNRVGLAFDASTAQKVTFTRTVPDAYAGGTVKVALYGKMASATSGGVSVTIRVQSTADGEDLTADSYDAGNLQSGTAVPGTAGLRFKVEVTLTNKDAMAVGEDIRFEIERTVGDVGDDAVGDYEVYGVVVRES